MTYRSRIRPSFMPVMAACAAAPQLAHAVGEMFGEAPVAGAADIGSDIHAAVMLALMPLADGSSEVPAVDSALAKFPNLSKWDAACVRRCVDFAVLVLCNTMKRHQDKAVQVLLEHHLDGSALGIDRGGTADLIVLVPFVMAHVIDWKCGHIDQGQAADHDSLATYACMVASTFKVRDITVTLFQPRSEEASRGSSAGFDAEALRAQETWTRDVVAAVTADNPEANAGLHCCKCPALVRCPTAQEFIMRVRESLEIIGDPQDPEAWGTLCDAAKVSEKFAADGIALAKGRLKAGGAIDRWALQPSGATTKIDPVRAIEMARTHDRLDELLAFASFRAEAARAIDILAPAVSKVEKEPSLKPVKGNA